MTQSQVKEKKQNEIRIQAERAQKVSSILGLGLKELNSFKKLKEKEVQEAEDKAASRISEIRAHLQVEEDKVVALEQRREIALKPVKELIKKAEIQLEKNKAEAQNLKAELIALEKKKAEIYGYADRIQNREHEVKKIEEEIKIKEQKSRDEAEHIADSLVDLNNKWVEFHTAVAQTNQVLMDKEIRLNQGVKANEITKQSLDREKQRLESYKTQLLDERGVLDRAWDELKIKEQKYGASS